MVSRAGKWVGRVGAAAMLTALSLTLGCGNFWVYPGSTTGSTSAGISGDVVYVANQTTETVAGFQVGTGTLTAVTNSPYSLGFVPTALAVTPGNTFLYAGSSAGLVGYSIGSGGVLTALSSTCGSNSICLPNVRSMAVTPDGQWLLILDNNGVSIDQFQINTSTGALSTGAGASYAIPGSPAIVPGTIAISPSVGNNSYYVFAALGTGGTIVYTFNTSTGVFSNLLTLAPLTGSADEAVAVGPNATYLYVARSGTSQGVQVYSIGQNGTLTSGNMYAAGDKPFSVVVNSAGTNVFVANQTDSTISGYSVSGSTLTALSGSPYASGLAVSALTQDSTGDYLLAASQGGNPDLAMYSISSMVAGGRLPAATTATGTDPTGAIAIAATF